ncbi:MAG: hypothetical protein IT477_10830 [Rhodanobacteraceae bacterium]|nr:hypothetical protein [Rhodanobacteraceae bacterium]
MVNDLAEAAADSLVATLSRECCLADLRVLGELYLSDKYPPLRSLYFDPPDQGDAILCLAVTNAIHVLVGQPEELPWIVNEP